ncbi:aldo/keto reductase [Paenibacillus sp. IB182496]|uniref:Aldo/keto reductase n=1 Tax=Paenibacillus sabuli TaxID=2772509 RepID=A0A927BX24_9BACL|nr:aldo/keto reductase [Paenibacillus sabuli]MBD2847195.1 aldo/keto reductase [Paenibacillus sabuli]
MQYNLFPGSEQQVSRLGFGAMGLGGWFEAKDEAYMVRSVLLALERGVNLIDTARAYGDSERIIGEALRQWKGERPFVATKLLAGAAPAGMLPGAGMHYPLPVETAYPPGSITESAHASLRELGVDAVDLLQLHTYWPQWDDADYWMEELIRLKEQGKARFIGISLPDHRHDLAYGLIRSGAIDSVQTVLNIFDSVALDSLVPICQQHDVAVIARVILDEGGLTGFLQADTEIPESDYRHNYFDVLPRQVYLDRVERLRSYIPEHAESLTELAIRFAMQHPGVTTALTSMHRHDYAAENIAAAGKAPLDDAFFEKIKIRERWIRHFYHARRHLV